MPTATFAKVTQEPYVDAARQPEPLIKRPCDVMTSLAAQAGTAPPPAIPHLTPELPRRPPPIPGNIRQFFPPTATLSVESKAVPGLQHALSAELPMGSSLTSPAVRRQGGTPGRRHRKFRAQLRRAEPLEEPAHTVIDLPGAAAAPAPRARKASASARPGFHCTRPACRRGNSCGHDSRVLWRRSGLSCSRRPALHSARSGVR